MTDRAQELMNAIWDARNNGADTEEKLVAAILTVAVDRIKCYNAQNDILVLDRNDMLELANEIIS